MTRSKRTKRRRVRPGSDPLVRVNITATPTELEAIDAVAAGLGLNRSQYVVRAALASASPGEFLSRPRRAARLLSEACHGALAILSGEDTAA